MPEAKSTQSLQELVKALKVEEVLDIVKTRLDNGDDPLEILNECQQGVEGVGLLYEQKEYFVSGLIVAAEILKEVVTLTAPHIQKLHSGKCATTVLVGTAKGDIHDIGKDMFIILLKCYGFNVIDLGVDVPPHTFLKKAIETKPHIIGISALLTHVYDAIKETVYLIQSELPENIRPPSIIIGGGMMDETIRQFVGADHWSQNAMAGVRLCQKITKP